MSDFLVLFLRICSAPIHLCNLIFSNNTHKKDNQQNGILKSRKLKVILILFVLSTLIYTLSLYNKPVWYVYLHKDVHGKCIIPDIDPFDKSIMEFYWHPDPIRCDKTISLLYVDHAGYLQYNKTAVNQVGYRNSSCAYSLVKRIQDDKVIFEPEVTFNIPFYVPSDFFKVVCKNIEGKIIYSNLHEKIDYRRAFKSKTIRNETKEQISIIIFGLDSVSRLAAERKLPRTMKYLKESLGAYIFKGYTKVGDNTFPNIVPVLTGKRAWSRELPKINYEKDFFDDVKYPLLFNNFSEKGYVTFHAEDFPELSIFNYLMRGFNKPPTDHYIRPLFLAMQEVHPVQTTLDAVFLFLENQKINLKKTSSLCYGNRPKHMILLDYYKKYIETYRGKLKFSLSWLTEIGHEYVNFLELGDNDFMEFLKWLDEGEYLENTVLLFMSDHGSRIDKIRNTYIGSIEERMPLLSIVIPAHLKAKYPHIHVALQTNTNSLTSPFDVHEFLSDILNENFKNHGPFKANRALPRGISLLRNIPDTRTCSDAAIPEHYCACYSSSVVNSTEPKYKVMSKYIVKQINNNLNEHQGKCAKLQLQNVKEVRRISSGLQRMHERERFTIRSFFTKPEHHQEERYLILLETVPGNGLFEATLNYNTEGTMNLLGDVSRTNRYGNQSICIQDKRLRLYCYCMS